jgi:hypothetical protein
LLARSRRFAVWWVAGAYAQEGGAAPITDTAATDTAGTTTLGFDTGTTPIEDTAPWVDGLTAADLAGERGGAPVASCAHADGLLGPGIGLGLLVAFTAGRIRRRP